MSWQGGGYNGPQGYGMNACDMGSCGQSGMMQKVVTGAYFVGTIWQVFVVIGSINHPYGDNVSTALKGAAIATTVISWAFWALFAMSCCAPQCLQGNQQRGPQGGSGQFVRIFQFVLRLDALAAWTLWILIYGQNQAWPMFPCTLFNTREASCDQGRVVVSSLSFVIASFLAILAIEYSWRDNATGGAMGGNNGQGSYQRMNELAKHYSGSDGEEDLPRKRSSRSNRHQQQDLSVNKKHRSERRASIARSDSQRGRQWENKDEEAGMGLSDEEMASATR